MKRLYTAILAVAIALVFMLYMVTYTVGYNEIAIVTTFDRAADPDAQALKAGRDSGSVIQEPGLKFKWPWPIQRVKTYPTQLQVLRDTTEQISLADSSTIVISFSLTWRVEDPLAFFRSFETIERANSALRGHLGDLRKEVTKYQFNDLVSQETGRYEKLAELEKQLKENLEAQLDESYENSHGVMVAEVSVGKLLYAATTAGKVNERMKAIQERKAAAILNQGTSEASAITAQANADRTQLVEFANTAAQDIENEGREEANRYLAQIEDQNLATYLRQLEALEKILANRTTFVLNAQTFSPLDMFIYGPGGKGNESRLFNKPAAAQPAEALAPVMMPTPLSPQEQAKQLRLIIEQTRERLKMYEAQLKEFDEQPAPLPVGLAPLEASE